MEQDEAEPLREGPAAPRYLSMGDLPTSQENGPAGLLQCGLIRLPTGPRTTIRLFIPNRD